MAFEVNKYQTALTDEVLENMSQEAREILLDAINNVVFIRNLISPDRKYAKDLQRDADGKIIVDLCNPHILENMDYFRPTGNHYRQYGTLTNLRPNANPNSEFGQWIREEINRIWYGMVRPEDGEWIPGDMYFYLNYTPILQSKVRKGTRQADRIVDFPEIWEASYLWFHYVDQARNGGLYNDFTGGQHCVHIARRGVGKSFTSAAMLAKLFIVGENVHAKKSVRGLVTAYQKEYLTKDGILNKFIDVIDFCADNTQFPSKRLKASIQEMAWKMGYLDAVTGVAKGTGNEVIGVSSKDDSDKIRGKRANKIIFEEFGAFMNFIDVWNTTIPSVQEGDIAFGQLIAQGCVCENTKVYKANGEPVLIQDLKKEDGILGFKDGKVSVENITHMNIPTFKPCVRITTTSGRILECSTDHPILVRKLRSSRKKHNKNKRQLRFDYSFEPAINLLNRKENYIMVSVSSLKTNHVMGGLEGAFPEKVKSVEFIGMKKIYNLTAGVSHTYLANDIITHNTGGTRGSDFSGALEIIYNPKGYGVYGLPNVFDRNTQGKTFTVFFTGGYMNRKGYYNEDGVSDVIGALMSIIQDYLTVKYNSSDPIALTQRKAEIPITIQDSIMKVESTIYPIADLTDVINELDLNPKSFDDVYVGELGLKDGQIEFKPTLEFKPVRDFPHKDNKIPGAVEIFKMPEYDRSGKIYSNRYIAGIDVFDDDASNTMSLGAIKVLDLMTDKIVAQYTGRRMFADEFYEICRRLLLYYNARANYENNKKGLFAYFSRMNSTYLLTDTLEYLKDKDMVKGELYGNKAHPYSEYVYTPKGKLKWGDVKVGDFIYSTHNTLTQVIDIPFDSITDIYEIKLKDGRKVKASGNHLWRVIDWNGYEKILSTLDIKKYYYRNKGKYKEYKYYIPKNLGVNFEHREVKISPYFLGLLLGDGSLTKVTKNTVGFTSNIQDMKFYMEKLKYKYKTFDDRHHHIYIQNIKDLIKELNLENTKSRTKFIPDIYKFNSYNVRLDILRGLMDTDGCIGGDGNPTYTSVSKQLAQDVLWVGRSLGINGNLVVSENPFGKVYTVRFYTDTSLFYLERKNSKQRVSKTRHLKTAITYIKFVGRERAKCVSVDSHDSCYLVNDFITTHNSKGSPSTAPIKSYYRKCIRDWLLKPVVIIETVDDQMVETSVPQLKFLKTRSLLKELTLWNPDGNFDEHDALGMLMLLREDRLRLMGDKSYEDVSSGDKDYLGNDPFFSKNYDERKKKIEAMLNPHSSKFNDFG